MTPEIWSEKACRVLGHKRAYYICLTTGRPQIGEDSSKPNPFHYFYAHAANIIKKKYPDVLKPD